MTATRTPGITICPDGRFFIDKRYRGIRIGMRVGAISLDEAERRLQTRIQDVDVELARRAHPRPTFADCAARYLAQSREKRSAESFAQWLGTMPWCATKVAQKSRKKKKGSRHF